MKNLSLNACSWLVVESSTAIVGRLSTFFTTSIVASPANNDAITNKIEIIIFKFTPVKLNLSYKHLIYCQDFLEKEHLPV